MTLLAAALLLGAAATPADRFVALVKANSPAEASLLVKGDVAVDPNTSAELGGATIPVSRALAFTSQCEVSPSRTHAYENFYRLWWNCPVGFSADGAFQRMMVKVDLWPAGNKVELRNFALARAPNEELLKREFQISPADAENSSRLASRLASLGLAGDVAAMRSIAGGSVFMMKGEAGGFGAFGRTSFDVVVAMIRGCAIGTVTDRPFGQPSSIKWDCANRPAPGKSCYDIGYTALTRGEGYPFLFGREVRWAYARCGQPSPPALLPPSAPRPKAR